MVLLVCVVLFYFGYRFVVGVGVCFRGETLSIACGFHLLWRLVSLVFS